MNLPALALLLGLSAFAPGADFVSMHPRPRPEGRPTGMDAIDAALADSLRLKATRLVFVGDSITYLWRPGDSPASAGNGRKLWNESFNTPGSANYALNLGISGDRTEHVLYRIEPKAEGGLGELDSPLLNPDVMVLMIGINNAYAPDKSVADSVYAGVRAVLIALHERKPRARIVLVSLLPTAFPAMNTVVVQAVNARLRALVQGPIYAGSTRYLDLYPDFIDARGYQNRTLFNDGLHPNEAGYRVWRDKLVPLLAEMRSKKR